VPPLKIPPPDVTAAIMGKLRIIDRELKRHSAAIEAAVGVRYMEGLFLRIVAGSPGIRLTEVAKMMDLSQGASSNVKRALLQRQLLEEKMDLDDRRAILLYATPAGREAVERGKQTVRSALTIAASEMSREELLELDRLLGRVTERIEEINAEASLTKNI
jgi:DNA-binding MarR family transcriptional regulator